MKGNTIHDQVVVIVIIVVVVTVGFATAASGIGMNVLAGIKRYYDHVKTQ